MIIKNGKRNRKDTKGKFNSSTLQQVYLPFYNSYIRQLSNPLYVRDSVAHEYKGRFKRNVGLVGWDLKFNEVESVCIVVSLIIYNIFKQAVCSSIRLQEEGFLCPGPDVSHNSKTFCISMEHILQVKFPDLPGHL